MSGKNNLERSSRAGERVRMLERRQKAVDLRRARLTFEQIAKQLGVSTSQAWKDCNNALQELIAQTSKSVDFERQIELDSLDEIERIAREQFRESHRSAFQLFKVVDDETGEIVERSFLSKPIGVRTAREAAKTMLEVKRRRAKLRGLDAPTKHVVEVSHARHLFVRFAGLLSSVTKPFVPRDALPAWGARVNTLVSDYGKAVKAAER